VEFWEVLQAEHAYHATVKSFEGRLMKSLTERKKAVFIVCDRVEWYISYIQKRRPDLFDSKKQSIKPIHSITEE
jgi:hypothetical protein